MKKTLLIVFTFLSLAHLQAQTIRYVKPVASGTGDGSSWANASSNLQGMINAGIANDEVWVAAGLYLPTEDINGNMNPADPRTKTFVPKEEVKLYGGFSGTETAISQRDLLANQTILSGDIGQLNNTTDNSYHIITKRFNSLAVQPLQIDGFVLSGGNANVAGDDQNFFPRDKGGAVHIDGISFPLNTVQFTNCHFTLNNADASGGAVYAPFIGVAFDKCKFTANVSGVSGGAVYCFFNTRLESFTGCRFESNVSGIGGAIYSLQARCNIVKCDFLFNFGLVSGGALYNKDATGTYIETSSFISNSAANDGGALVQFQASAEVLNCTFITNTAGQKGGAAFVFNNGTRFTNCTIAGNTATGATGLGGGLYYDAFGEGYIRNTILWSNTTTANPADVNREEIYKENANRELLVQNSIVRDFDPVNTLNITWGLENSTADPLYTNPGDPNGADNIYNTSDDGLMLQAGSPAIDVGNSTFLSGSITRDIAGGARISGTALDLGAYERGPSCTGPSFSACPSSITANTAAGRCSANVFYTARITPTPLPTTITFSFSGATTTSGTGTGNGRSFNKGVTTVTITAVNSCSSATCTFTVTVNDNQAPAISCPGPLFASCPGDVPPPDISLITATDNCPGTVVTHRGDVISTQICENHYTLTRTYRATDAAGNFTECSQIITVDDQVAPVLTCPPPVTVSCASEVPAPDVNSVTITDNCGGELSVRFVIDEIFNQTCANRYSIRRRYRGLDACENIGECEQIITVNDQTPPVIICPAPVTVSCTGDIPAPDITAVTASDNCTGSLFVTHTGDVITNRLCDNKYTISRTYRATDACGNFSECIQVITVDDVVPPVINCPADISVTTDPNTCTANVDFTVTGSDNCTGPVTIISSHQSGSSFPIGTTTVTASAEDACGNISTCTFTVTVVDSRLPVITEQPADLAVCETGIAVFRISAANAITYQWQKKNGNNWEDITGETASSFTINNVSAAMNNNEYRVLVTGPCSIVASASARLTVMRLPSVSISASGFHVLLPNQSVDINATVNPPGGTYIWYLDGNILTGTTGSSVKNITVDKTGVYKLEYTAPNGCSKASAEITISALPGAKLWVYPNPNNGNFQVRYYNALNEKLTLLIYNAAGQKVYHKQFVTSAPYTSMNVENGYRFASGMYIVEVIREDGSRAGAVQILVQK